MRIHVFSSPPSGVIKFSKTPHIGTAMRDTPIFDNLVEDALDDLFDVGLLVMLTADFGLMTLEES